MVEASDEARLQAIGMAEGKIKSILKTKKNRDKIMEVLDLSGITECAKEKGALIEALAMKLDPSLAPYTKEFAMQVANDKWTKADQLTEGITWLKAKVKKHGDDGYQLEMAEFDKATGVGVVVTQKQIDAAVETVFTENAKAIEEAGHDYQFGMLLKKIKEIGDMKWADGKSVLDTVNTKKLALLGEAPVGDGKRKKAGKKTKEEKKPEEKKEGQPGDDEFEKQEEGKLDLKKLIPREMDQGNSAAILEAHRKFTGGLVHTRFPPEPNGYLHIGHAKSIRFNFTLASEYGGNTYLRFDDTNPCKENNEFIDHIKDIVNWLGYKPFKTTASSDYFQQLHDIAVDLIKKDKAYVCYQTAEEMKAGRESKTDSPWRNKPVAENLRNFEKMRQGRYAEGECSLRVKMDMQHQNPCMRDFVAYRIRYVGHPHSGDQWCIYPTYDFTHCLVDSIENVTHSLCTLEFEIRRESYFQLLKDAGMYKPFVWEFGRLNMSNTVLSKRKIEKLVDLGYVTGWDDPRLHTI